MSNLPCVRVGLLWHSLNSGNLGVGALTVGNLALAEDAARKAGVALRFSIIAAHSPNAAFELEAEIDETLWVSARNVLDPRRLWRLLGSLDCVLDISAGDSFTDIYGPKRFAYQWLTKMMTVWRRRPLILSPQTIGPFTRQPYRMLAAAAIRRARVTVARDPLSFAAVETLASRARRLLAADVAFRLPFLAPAPRTDGKFHVGVNVSGLLWHQSLAGEKGFDLSVDYVDLNRRLLDALSTRPDTVVHLITHANGPPHSPDDDARVADALAKSYPNAIRAPNFAGPSAAKSYIAGLDFLVAARMHACIAAFSAGVPVVPIAYSRKFIGLFEGVLDYRNVLPVRGYDVEQALRFILDRLDRRNELAAEVAAGNRKVAPLLDRYVDALAELFAEVAAR